LKIENCKLQVHFSPLPSICRARTRSPKVTGVDGRNAVELASRILEKINTHQWEGHSGGPVGPTQVPASLGPLFQSEGGTAEAA
jgi:hypothetical protein